MIIECIDCRKRVRAKCRNKKRCKPCAAEAIRRDSRKYKRSPKGRRVKKIGDRRYKANLRRRIKGYGTIKCIDCEKRVRSDGNRQKRCKICSAEATRRASRRHENTPKGNDISAVKHM